MSAVTVPYLGKPGAMRALPSPNSPVKASPTRSDTAHTLLSGGVAVTTVLNPKRSYSLPYQFLDSAGAATLLGFYNRLYGLGPFVLVDPSARNVLTLDASSCGLRTQADDGWIQSTGTIVRATTGGPTGVDSGILTWSSLAASATLQPGTVANTADIRTAPVWVPAEAATASLYMKASSATSVTLQITGYDAAGAVVASFSQAASLTTSFQRVSVTAPAGAGGFSSVLYVLPRLVLGGTVPTNVTIAGGQLEYGTAATTWEPGQGSPRVLPTASPGRDVEQTIDFATDHTFLLAEV